MTPEQAVDAARVRAAIAYAGMGSDDADLPRIAEAAGFSERTLYRVLKEGRPLTLPEARALARACRVPVDFLLHGWAFSDDPTIRRLMELDDRMQQIAVDAEARELEVHQRLAEIAAAIRGSRSQGGPPQ